MSTQYDPERAGARCSECSLRGRPVVGPEGPSFATLAIIGEGPGLQEEKAGRPFVGPSGILLNEFLRNAGLKRETVFLSNAALCRADVPGVKGPKRHDMKTFMAYLRKENAAAKKAAKARKEPFTPKLTPFEACKPRLLGELKFLEKAAQLRGQPNGLVVVPVGNFAAQAVIGMQGISKLRGSVFSVDTEKLFKNQ